MTAPRATLLALTLLAGLLRLFPLTAGPATGIDAAEWRTIAWLDRVWPVAMVPPTDVRHDPPRDAILAGRIVAAAASTAAIPLAFTLARPLGGAWAGLAAGGFLAVNPMAVRAGKTMWLDAFLLPVTLLVLGNLFRWRIMTGTLVALPLGAALVVGVHAAGAPTDDAAPLAALDPSGLAWLVGHAVRDALGLDTAVALVAALCLVGLPGHRRAAQQLGPAVALAMGAVAAALSLPTPRFADLLPALAGLAPAAGVGVANLIAMGKSHGIPRRAAATALGLGLWAGLTLPGLIRSSKLDRLLARPDTRTLAAAWLAEHASPGEMIAVVRPDLPWGKPRLPATSRTTGVRDDENVADLRARGVHWLVVESSNELRAFAPGLSQRLDGSLRDAGLAPSFDVESVKPGSPPPRFDLGEPLFAPVRHVASVTRPGPRVRIWCVAAPGDCG